MISYTMSEKNYKYSPIRETAKAKQTIEKKINTDKLISTLNKLDGYKNELLYSVINIKRDLEGD